MSLKPTLFAALLLASSALAPRALAQTAQKEPPAPPAAAEKTVSADQAKKDAAYEALLKKLKGGDKTVDFKELRMAYADSSRYNPYGGDSEARQAMFAALNAKQWDEALKQSAKILEKNYVDLNAQFVAAVANHEKGVADKADFHRFVVKGLFDSITNSGDGKSTDKAFVVISTDEEYALLNFLGLRPMGQALLNVGGHSYDKLTAVDPKTNEKHELYFNIDKPFGWLGNSLKH
jgi:Domain of unknown function (DUF4919)